VKPASYDVYRDESGKKTACPFIANFKNMEKPNFYVQDYDKRSADQRITAFVKQH